MPLVCPGPSGHSAAGGIVFETDDDLELKLKPFTSGEYEGAVVVLLNVDGEGFDVVTGRAQIEDGIEGATDGSVPAERAANLAGQLPTLRSNGLDRVGCNPWHTARCNRRWLERRTTVDNRQRRDRGIRWTRPISTSSIRPLRRGWSASSPRCWEVFAEAQDCVQEAFVKAWLHRTELDVDGSPEAWVRRTAWRVGVSLWRAAAATVRAYGRRGIDPATVPGPSEDRGALVAALRTINAEQRRAIVLRHLCDLSVDEVARETDVPTGTVKARLARGREALARVLGPDAGVADDDTHGKAHHV